MTTALVSLLTGRSGAQRRRHDGRGHAAGPGAPDRWRQAEGAGRATCGPRHRDPAEAQRSGPRRRARGGARRDDVPPRRRRARGSHSRSTTARRRGTRRQSSAEVAIWNVSVPNRCQLACPRSGAPAELDLLARFEREVAGHVLAADGGRVGDRTELRLLLRAPLLARVGSVCGSGNPTAGWSATGSRRRARRSWSCARRRPGRGSGSGIAASSAAVYGCAGTRRRGRRAARPRRTCRGTSPPPGRSRSSRPRGRGR